MIDLRTLARAYDRSAASYDEKFRALQRPKYRAAAGLLVEAGFAARPLEPRALILDAGAGTGLFLEWLADPSEPHANLRALLLEAANRGRLVSLDASAGMLKQAVASGRTRAAVAADLAHPPLRKRSCALVVCFTSLLEEVPESLRAIGALVAAGGFLCATFLARESPAPEDLSRWCGLSPTSSPLAAGQDLVHVVRSSSAGTPGSRLHETEW